MGVVTIRSFFLPSHPDKTPPIGVKIIPLIQVSAAKVEPSYSFKVTSSPYVSLRFLYKRLALVNHCDSHLSSKTLPWQLFIVIKVILVYQICNALWNLNPL